MKNYLFRPFSNDDDKIAEFNTIRNYLPKKFRSELIMFMGSLESYYDVIITHLKAEKDALKCRCDELKAENKECRDALEEQVSDLMIDKDRLVEQVSSNRGNSSSTHTHTISKEIQDYMHHNPNCKGVRLFILPIESFDGNGIYDANYGDVYYKDGME